MGRGLGRIALAVCAIAGSTFALAHELECTKGFNEVDLDATGALVIDQNEFPLTVGKGAFAPVFPPRFKIVC